MINALLLMFHMAGGKGSSSIFTRFVVYMNDCRFCKHLPVMTSRTLKMLGNP